MSGYLLLALTGSPYGFLITGDSLPPRLYEILNCGIATSAWLAWMITARYLVTALVEARRLGAGWGASFRTIYAYRLAVGFLIFLSGECPRMTWVWLARYVENIHGPPLRWMSSYPGLMVPVLASGLTVLGLACIVRALIPMVWGRYAYRVTLGTVISIVVLTQVFRP